jgi:hypothetical protein
MRAMLSVRLYMREADRDEIDIIVAGWKQVERAAVISHTALVPIHAEFTEFLSCAELYILFC